MYTRAEFFSLVRKTPTCWLWEGMIDPHTGYGFVYWRGSIRPRRVHIIAWELYHGPVTPGKHILHNCDVKHCVKKKCLYAGNRKDNARDYVQRQSHKINTVKLTPDDVREIRQMAKDIGMPPRPGIRGMSKNRGAFIKRIMLRFPQVKYKAIRRILDGESWGYLE